MSLNGDWKTPEEVLEMLMKATSERIDNTTELFNKGGHTDVEKTLLLNSIVTMQTTVLIFQNLVDRK